MVGGLVLRPLDPVFGEPFSNAIQGLPLQQVAQYVFGSGAVAAAGQTAITNATQLGNFFNPFLDRTGTFKINSELEVYNQSFASGTNHVFNASNLQLTGTLGATGNAVAPTVSGTMGANPSFSPLSFTTGNIGLSATTGLSIGQLLIFWYTGIYVVTNISGSGSTATITTTALFSSPTTNIAASSFLPFAFMPYYYAATNNSFSTGATTLTFAAVPAGVVAGMNVAFYNSTLNSMIGSQNYVVQSGVTGTNVPISPSLASADQLTNGQGVFFLPSISSGQIWTKQYYGIPGLSTNYFAVDAILNVPNSVVYNTGAGFTNAVSTSPYGSWPAMFLYSGNTGPLPFFDSSEIDIFEVYNNALRNSSSVDVNVRIAPAGRGSGANAITPDTSYLYNPNIWAYTLPNFTYNSATTYGGTFHHFQLLVTPDKTYVYIDGQCIKISPYMWTSGCQFQLGLNLAIGALAPGLGTNGLVPLASTNFPIPYQIQQITIYEG